MLVNLPSGQSSNGAQFTKNQKVLLNFCAAGKPLGEQPEDVAREIASWGQTAGWKVLSQGVS